MSIRPVTRLTTQRKPNQSERNEGAEVVFVRTHPRTHVKHTIKACRCYESWEQWGAEKAVLADNVPVVEAWRRNLDRTQS